MDKTFNILNELLVENFNDLISIEQKALSEGEFSDLSITEIHTIEAIGMYSARTMSEVAADLDITVGTLTIAINNLVKKGYVERRRAEEDRRVVLIQLNKRGKLAYRIHNKFHMDMIKATIEDITEEEEQVLVKALEKLNNFFKEKYHLPQGKKENKV
ncbi:MarR family winged helix-turn-helix transcriptional regulator [Clostridium omnivorum]|uniref:MarR family transcriptional regulator n=1 Tax=Clostridium omnivorum TaxID=1604902 RepID=A0ABQ5N3Q4_9CLOT|nr:MarR family winged helix-turn-helix transcriptional regulator [Clostridium sp. E14]GLC29868.1 MarR family transcriptional regulator [Clostridium sp. E14]